MYFCKHTTSTKPVITGTSEKKMNKSFALIHNYAVKYFKERYCKQLLFLLGKNWHYKVSEILLAYLCKED